MRSNLQKTVIQRIKEDGGFEQAVELNLCQLKLTTISPQIKKILEKVKIVEVVLLSENQLENIDNLPDWNLTAIDLSNNRLTDSVLFKLVKFKNLMQLLIVQNQIKSMDALKPIFQLIKLEEVDFSGNPVSQLPNFNQYLFNHMPSLQIVNRKDRSGKLVPEQDQDFQQGDESDEYGSGQQQDEQQFQDQEQSQSSHMQRK